MKGKKPNKDLKELATAYEQGTLSPDERTDFEATLASNEDALNAVDSFYVAYQAKMVGRSERGHSEVRPEALAIVGEIPDSYINPESQKRQQQSNQPLSAFVERVIEASGIQMGPRELPGEGYKAKRISGDPRDQELRSPSIRDNGRTLRFIWRPIPKVSGYGVTIIRCEDDEEIWSGTTFLSWFDYRAVHRLVRGEEYFWRLSFEVAGEEQFLFGSFAYSP